MKRKGKNLFAVLVREHEHRLTAFARSCVRDPSAADDVVQESFITAWRQLHSYDQQRPFALWLRGIAKNKILEHYRRCAKEERRVHTLTPEVIDRIGVEQDRLISTTGDTFLEQLGALRSCLASLTKDDVHVVESHYLARQTCHLIALQLRASEETVKKRLQRIRSRLRRCILGKLDAEADNV